MRAVVMENLFDPFENRADRDVRNILGSAFISMLHQNRQDPVTNAVAALDKENISGRARKYIKYRCDCYERVWHGITSWPADRAGDMYAVAGLLWDEQLFFECHEWLEQDFRRVQGREKQLLQALIRTAGTFELLAYGRVRAAVSVAQKALAVLEASPSLIPAVFDIQPKILRLKAVIRNRPV